LSATFCRKKKWFWY